VLMGVLAVGAVALVLSVYGYARQGSATPASGLAASTPVITPITSQPPQPSGPELAAPTPAVASLPDGNGGSGPVAMAAQSEAPALSRGPAPTAAPAGQENHPKDHGRGHGKHGHPGGD
jgi:hypothetical protein